MSSEAITRNDLTAILNEVLPPTPSEHRKLLWANPNPTANFATTTLLNGTDLTVYDEIEVQGVNYTGFQSIMPIIRVPIGSHGNLIGLAGSTGDSAGMGFLVARGISVYSDKIVIASAMGVATNGTSWSANDNNMIPQKIYGIKYDYVAPPQVEIADYIVEQGTSGIWTYRKWNSGVAECWGTRTHTTTQWNAWGGIYEGVGSNYQENFPTNLFVDRPIATATPRANVGGLFLETYSVGNKDKTDGYLPLRGAAGTLDPVYINIHAIGRWK